MDDICYRVAHLDFCVCFSLYILPLLFIICCMVLTLLSPHILFCSELVHGEQIPRVVWHLRCFHTSPKTHLYTFICLVFSLSFFLSFFPSLSLCLSLSLLFALSHSLLCF